MSIQLKNGKSTSMQIIARFEKNSGFLLPDSFKKFVLNNDGAKPETNIFPIESNNESGVNRFIPIEDIMAERRKIESIPNDAFPIAWAEGGNYVLLNGKMDGHVFFWDHERPEMIIKIADDFDLFLSFLKPFDISKIEIKPGQVKSVWIDPDFLNSIKKRT